MILAIDIGNSNIVLGTAEGGRIVRQARMATDSVKTSDQYCVELRGMLALLEAKISEIDGVILSSVVPPVQNSFKTAIRKLSGITPIVVGPGVKTGLNIQMENPSQVGGDLVVAAVAALEEYSSPVFVVDMGTATTISVIGRNRTFLGGCICPGVKISAEALSARTAQLPGISLEQPKHIIAKNTIDSMRSGLMIGAAAMIDGMLDRMEEELGESANVVATGGIAKYIVPMCKRTITYDKDLLLKGLIRLYDYNQGFTAG